MCCCCLQGRLQVSWPTTPLIVAAKMGHTAMVALLMDRGASVAGTSKVGDCWTALRWWGLMGLSTHMQFCAIALPVRWCFKLLCSPASRCPHTVLSCCHSRDVS